MDFRTADEWRTAYDQLPTVYKLDFNKVDSVPTTEQNDEAHHFISPANIDDVDEQDDIIDILRQGLANYENLCSSMQFQHFPHYDWSQFSHLCSEENIQEFSNKLDDDHFDNNVLTVHENTLNREQRAVFDRVVESVNNGNQLLSIVQASAGCGKSYLINALKTKFNSACVTAAFTGSAAALIGGHTLSSLFGIPVGKFTELSGRALLTKKVVILFKI